MKLAAFPAACHALGAAIALFVGAAPAQADIAEPGTVLCSDSRAADALYNPSYVTCSAHFDNVPAPQEPQPALVAPFAGYGDFNFIGQTKGDKSTAGPFEPFGPDSYGILQLKLPQSGLFVIALASFNDYSLYLYDASGIVGGVSSIAFSTRGTTDQLGGPFGLEYANLYTQAVPEPTTYALMIAGLAATGLALRRRTA